MRGSEAVQRAFERGVAAPNRTTEAEASETDVNMGPEGQMAVTQARIFTELLEKRQGW